MRSLGLIIEGMLLSAVLKAFRDGLNWNPWNNTWNLFCESDDSWMDRARDAGWVFNDIKRNCS